MCLKCTFNTTHPKEKLNKSLLVSLFFSLLRKYKIATLEKFERRRQFLGKQYKCNYASVFALQARQSASFLYAFIWLYAINEQRF